jgi:hypothetical protein
MQVPGLDVGFEISGEATSLANVRNAAAQVPLPLQRVGWPRLPVPALLADGAHRAPSRPRASSGHHAHRAAIRRSRPGTAGEGHESMPKCLPPGTRRGTPRSHKHRRLPSGRADQPVSPGVHSGDCSFHSLQKLWDLGGVPLASFIQTRVMSSKKLVDAAVAGFIKGESNTLPSVADASLQWQERATTAGGDASGQAVGRLERATAFRNAITRRGHPRRHLGAGGLRRLGGVDGRSPEGIAAKWAAWNVQAIASLGLRICSGGR